MNKYFWEIVTFANVLTVFVKVSPEKARSNFSAWMRALGIFR